MRKTKITLDRKWKEIVFAASGFGPNLLMVLMMAYFTDAVIPTGLSADISFWSYGGVMIVQAVLFPILWTIGRVFDGLIDVPAAALADSIGTNKKRWRILFITFFPMIIAFTLCWIPIFGMGKDISTLAQVGNSIWIFVMSIIFFTSYTFALLLFYGSLSQVCANQTQRARVSAYKSTFDTINYALVYAAIPAIFKTINVPIWKVAIFLSPLMITIFIPRFLFVQKKEVEPQKVAIKEKRVSIGESIALTFSSRPFTKWLIVDCISFFGLQMFLVSQNTLISGVMNLGATWAALLNTAAFAPVPIMLYFFNKVRRKKGIRFGFQTCLASFGLGIISFCLAGTYFWGDNIVPKLIIGAIGGIIGSWGIGGFFMTPYLIPSQIANVEKQVTGKDHSAMYFAMHALATSSVGAIASSLIYNYLKQWVKPGQSYEWKCGVSLVPFIVLISCVAGFFLCFLMPKTYKPQVVAQDIKKTITRKLIGLKRDRKNYDKKVDAKINRIKNSNIDMNKKNILIQAYENKRTLKLLSIDQKIKDNLEILENINTFNKIDDEEEYKYYEQEGVLERMILVVLSGFLFGIFDLLNSVKKCKKVNIVFSTKDMILIYLSIIVPFLSVYTNGLIQRKLENRLKELKGKYKSRIKISMITSAFLPLFTNLVAIRCRIIVLNQIDSLIDKKEK